ncbi:LiaF transmembrane domain-containing protein [Massilia pseudoviolaceinigra]|uniref:LiaF transmembrane domain-containing protein n=1 Tax=Massilia pseudoviolaceinigra TaxID=3057165 RepID=UPI002796B86C|nr:DUF5668 domain-containing protein [Massilia sp. CCM 9206]MDQ1923303.1 DUF5668 domain-containing protein [Massilia sp. CCM 9206]
MSNKSSYEWRKQLMWGLLLIGFGTIVLLEQMDVIHVDGLWHYAPLVLTVMGLNKMIGFPTAKDFTTGLWMVFLSLWLLSTFENLFGLTFSNGWPIPVIFCGVTMILEPFIERRLAPEQEPHDEK